MRLLAFVLLASWFLVVELIDDQQYCALRYRRLCQGKGTHVGCQFPESGPGPSCKNFTPIKFQNELKHFITNYINRRRQRISAGLERVRGGLHLPKPEIMMLVEWDRELAMLAQRLADQCTFIHDDCRATLRYPYAGQTVGEVRWRRSSDSESLTAQRAIRRVFDAWWGERRRVHPHQLTAPFRLTAKGAVWGHFSQLAVWTLRAVGCGAVRHGANYPRLLLVCDFSHTNMLGQRTISPGPLAPCPIHTARKLRSSYPLLCAPVRQITPTEQYEIDSDSEDEFSYTTDEEDIEETTTLGKVEVHNFSSYVVTYPIKTTTEVWPKYTQPKKMQKTTAEINTGYSFSAVHSRRTTRNRGVFFIKLDRELEDKKENNKANNVRVSYEDDREEYLTKYNVGWSTFYREKLRVFIYCGEPLPCGLRLDLSCDVIGHAASSSARRLPPQRHLTGNKADIAAVSAVNIVYKDIDGDEQGSCKVPVKAVHNEDIFATKSTKKAIVLPREMVTERLALSTDRALAVRHKWQHSRNRPKRPGASALLSFPVLALPRRPGFSSLVLDKEDEIQLFKDTGFNPSMMRRI